MVLRLCYASIAAFWLSSAALAWDGVLRVSLEADIRGTNPGVKRDANTDTVMHHIVESLVAYREDLSVAPLLAESYRIGDGGRSYRFDLRRGVRFHNGAALTADIVKWNWQRYLHPQTRWRCRSWYDGTHPLGVEIVSIDTPDASSVVFHLRRPSASFLHLMANIQCPSAIVHPASVGADGQWIEPIGTGPYRLAQWRRGEYVELQRSDHYHTLSGSRDGLVGAKIARAERLRFVVVPEVSVAKAALLAGDLDIVPILPLTLYAELQALPGITLHVQGLLNWMVLLMQTGDPLLADVRIRQALAHAIDIDRLAAYSTAGLGRANTSAIPDASPYYSPQQARRLRPFDLPRARELMQGAGYDGRVITLQTSKKQQELFDNAIIIHAMLRRAGFNVKLEVIDWATLLNNYYAGNFQLLAFSFTARTEPFLNFLTFTGSKKQLASYQWDDPLAIDLLRATETAFEPARRQSLFDRLNARLQHSVPIIGLYNKRNVTATAAGVRGYGTWVAGKPRLWGVSVE